MTLQLLPVVPETRSPSDFSDTMCSWDGTELFYRAWKPAAPSHKALVLFHRGHEHSGRFEKFVEELGLEDFWVFAWDARGHGRSPGERGYADRFADVVRDVDCFIRHVSERYDVPVENMAVLGHSVGAVAVAAWVHDYAPPVRAMVLATPAFRVKLYVPFALAALRLRLRFGGRSFVKSYVKARMLTHDADEAARYARDPLVSRSIATNILIDLHDTSTRLLEDAGAIRVPTLVVSAGADWVVKNSFQRRFFERLSSPLKRMEVFPRFFHSILHERDRDQPIRAIRDFISDAFHAPTDQSSDAALLKADRGGYTRDEFERLGKPLHPLCPRRFGFAIQRAVMASVCRLSDGFRLGWRTGFDSGESLDYVYRNEPRGFTPLGRFIDRIYLNTVGWRGIRQRKAHLQETLRKAIRQRIDTGQSARIIDVAAGPGRYALEVLREFGDVDVTAVLRDQNRNALDAGRRIAEGMKLENVAFEEGDAFDPQSLESVRPAPNIAIVSGLYELFADNDMVLRSLRGLARAVPDGGWLIYTNQPWHPQIEMIARVLVNREGKPWVMRRRTQAEMDALVRAAGFEKTDMLIGRDGIFTVSTARKSMSA